ncbi:NAD(P)-binding oxidoreductase [Nocardia mangyaensis]|uniref:NAD(P)-binding oxidoreductase n=1 Tax=Nocardia mangyaensis TaxID=2213200 RepID=UPI0026769C44|nr:NAD(P)-binding oxidoreductase [Nocardia mangyaensis]MDO3646505.1 SDR family oxidoreductase [Nocardia mangyaensis]
MRIVVAGGHGKIALLLARQLTRRGDRVHALIRDPGQAADIAATGGVPVIYDMERDTPADLAAAVAGSDAVVFAAGAGPGSGAARKYTVDLNGSVQLAEAAEATGVRRFVQISTMGAGSPPAPGTDEVWAAYIDAKTRAEADLRSRELAWTILRPGILTDAEGNGLVTLGAPPIPRGEVPRADVAATLASILVADNTFRRTLELVSGSESIETAVAAIR